MANLNAIALTGNAEQTIIVLHSIFSQFDCF